jgi:hypothetical protein
VGQVPFDQRGGAFLVAGAVVDEDIGHDGLFSISIGL